MICERFVRTEPETPVRLSAESGGRSDAISKILKVRISDGYVVRILLYGGETRGNQRNLERPQTFVVKSQRRILKISILTRSCMECLHVLQEIGITYFLKLKWAAGHAGVAGDEMANGLASEI